MILEFFLISLPYLYSNVEAVNKSYDAAGSFAWAEYLIDWTGSPAGLPARPSVSGPPSHRV